MAHASPVEQRLVERFVHELGALPDVRIADSREFAAMVSRSTNLAIALTVAGNPITLDVVVRKAAYPRDARVLVAQFVSRSRENSRGVVPFLIAESLSSGAKELLQSHRIGYFDSGGSMFLPAPNAFVLIDRPAPKQLEKTIRSMFVGRRAQVLHALLTDSRSGFGVNSLAERALVAASTVSDVFAELERLDWLESRGHGPNKLRHLREPAALLDAWATDYAQATPQKTHRFYVPGLKSDALIEHLSGSLGAREIEYALSYEAAAQRYAPFLSSISQVHIRLLPNALTDAALGELDARVVAEGANLTVIETKAEGDLLFRQQIDGVWLASPVQVYLDLQRGEGRSKELATHLRKERIAF